jgi:hypothetical protein
MEKEHGVLMIIPVNRENLPPEVRHLPYGPSPGMIPFPCERCGVKGWYGPKQAAKKKESPETPILCIMCVIALGQEARQRGEEVTARVQHLDES